MFEYLSRSDENECRDLLNEIDAGELDEQYLIKHADDYSRHAATHLPNMLRVVAANLWALVMRSSRPKQITQPAKSMSRPAM